ncbi:coiled-coil-helix-coiled-coil-helix domain-containing protein 8-like, partial [Triplophysa rosa]
SRLRRRGPLFQQLLFASVLEGGHALFKLLNQCLTFPPVLILCHTFLQRVMQLCAACLGDHLIHRIIFITGSAPVMWGRRSGRH